MKDEGITFVHESPISLSMTSNMVNVDSTNGSQSFDMLFISTGRVPNIDGMSLDKAGVVLSQTTGHLVVDDYLRTTASNIYAAGDVLGGPQFTHYAAWQAFQAVRNILLPSAVTAKLLHVPSVTFTDPEIAHVGMNEEQALQDTNNKLKILHIKMEKVDRAITDDEDNKGFIKILVHSENGRVLGACIVAPRAGEMISEFAVVIGNRLGIDHIANAIHPYPTYSVGVQQVAADAAIERVMSGMGWKILSIFGWVGAAKGPL
jgi:pyruvate/2-oxoglutarate dehydrogenase complex dihydrolipoamide dehydrogenase (E3) component